MAYHDEEDVPLTTSLSPSSIIVHQEPRVPCSITSFRGLIAWMNHHTAAYRRPISITPTIRFPTHYIPNLKSYLKPPPPPTTVSRTEWLNGLRGVASLFVFWYHFAYYYHWAYRTRVAFAGGPHGGEQDNYWITQLPFFRLMSSGDAMVCVFYVVSGFSLSIRPLALMRDQDWDKLLSCLTSATWRRAGRLYLPCLIVTFFCGVVLMQLGLYEYGRVAAEDKSAVVGEPDRIPELMGSFSEQAWDWYAKMVKWQRPHAMDPQFMVYDPHLWTIPVEFRCSLVLYVSQLALSRTRPMFRRLTIAMLTWYCAFIIDQWEIVLFYAGFLIADLDTPSSPALTLEPEKRTVHKEEKTHVVSRALWWVVLLGGMYLMGAPSTWQDNAPGYMSVFAFRDYYVEKEVRGSYRYPMMAGAILFVLACTHLPRMRQLLSTSLMRYLGRISFMLYVGQHPMNAILGYRLVLGLRTLFVGTWNVAFVQKEWLFALAFPIHTALGIGIAEAMTRVIDDNCLKLMRWAEKKCFIKS